MTTQHCAECGTRAEPGQSFCDSCGAVLRWDQPAPPRNTPPAPGGPSTPGASSPTGTAPPPTGTAPNPTTTPTPAGTAPNPTTTPPGTPADRTAAPTPAGTPPDRTAAPAPAAATPGTAPSHGTTPTPRTAPSHTTAPAPSTPPAHGTAPTAGNPDDSTPRWDAFGGSTPASTGLAPTRYGTQAAQARSDTPATPPGATHPTPTPQTPPPTPSPTPTPSPSPTRAPDETAPTVPVPNALTDTMSDRARSLLVPVDDPEPARPAPPPAVAPVLPGRPEAQRPQVRTPAPQHDLTTGPPCPWCATPNRPDRHFCVRCAMPLAGRDDTTPARLPWWRRLFGSRRQETPWAGDRPRLRRVFDRIGTWIGVVVVVTLVVLGFLYIPDGVQATRDHFAKRAPVSPDRVTASRSYPGHKPELVFDKLNDTWWGPGVSQSGEGEWIEASFEEPTRLLDVIITPGVSTRPDQLGESALPHRVKATVTLKDGKTVTRELTLDQGAGGQRRPFRVGDATKVRFTVESAHAASAKKQIAIAEIEFFGRSSANRT
ncbi:zinc ribbon domain-containing protein [Streptomyces sp. NPDC005876]|uniref:zinc ribbon domain-containing protein n=1 Tax=Streptomyces sp. NPDC005876 TaxID=3157076 RepID=UPI0033C7957B